MNEQNQMPEQDSRIAQAEHTKQNNKDAIKLAEKGAATYFAGPEGAAVVNQLHNTPGIGKALDKVEDKAAEKLGKNRAFSHMANQLGDSGMLKAGNQALDIAGSAGGGSPTGSTAPTAAGAQGANVAGGSSQPPGSTGGTSSQMPSGQSGLGGAGGLGLPGGGGLGSGGGNNPPPEDGKEKSASANTIDGMKKVGKVLKFIAPAMPIILSVIAIFLVVVILMAQVMMIKDKITGAIEGTMEFGQKIVNFISGDGWNTQEEAFFYRLREAYENFGVNDGELLDIPLISSTIHYSKTIDISIYDGEDGENEDKIGTGQNNYSDTGNDVWGTIIGTHQTWSFYKVADVKLGNMGAIIPGTRGLLGHLVDTYITTETVCLSEAFGRWKSFFEEIIDFNFTSYEEFKEIYGNDTYDAIFATISRYLPTNILSFADLHSLISNIEAFNVQEQSYLNWVVANTVYEFKELYYFLIGDYNDEHLINSPLAYYNNLSGSESGENIFDIIKKAFEKEDDEERDSEGKCIIPVKVPVFGKRLDYKSYYRYLVNIYIPNTYYFGQKLGEDYQYDDLIIAANEIFDQKYMYEYLVDYLGDDIYGGCGFSYSGDSTTVDVDTEMIANIYVNVLKYGERHRTSTNIAETVPLKDYVIGVTYREIGASVSDNEEYLKANIIAIKSYTLGRPVTMGDGIKQDGDKYYINMRNSTNDQVYCSLTNGCMDAPDGNRKPAPSQALIDYLGRLYDEVADKFLYDSKDGNFVGSYRNKASLCAAKGLTGSCLGQEDSKEMGNAGKDHETILGTFYQNNIGIVNVSTGEFSTGVLECISPGLELGADGYYVRTQAPVRSDVYFNPPYNGASNIGQCVWYVKGRACEIIGNSRADASKKEKAMTTMQNMHGNGNQWYSEHLTSVFGSSTDYRYPRAGAIAVYDWTYNDEHGNRYGHSVIVEKVEGNTVWVSQGWNKCDGAYGASAWNCVDFQYSSYTIEQMKNLGSSRYKFIGYVYLLD